jgi:hypothetical protein
MNMSKEYKKRIKEQYGRPAVLGTDVLSTSVASVSGVVGHTALGVAGAAGCSRFVLPRAGYLDYFIVNCSPAVTAGNLAVSLSKNGVVVASGELTSTNADRIERCFNVENSSQVTVASGDLLTMAYAISSALSPGITAVSLNARAGLTYRDPA